MKHYGEGDVDEASHHLECKKAGEFFLNWLQ